MDSDSSNRFVVFLLIIIVIATVLTANYFSDISNYAVLSRSKFLAGVLLPNVGQGTLTITKFSYGGEGTFNYTIVSVVASEQSQSTSVTTSLDPGGLNGTGFGEPLSLDAGLYDIAEIIQSPWFPGEPNNYPNNVSAVYCVLDSNVVDDPDFFNMVGNTGENKIGRAHV